VAKPKFPYPEAEIVWNCLLKSIDDPDGLEVLDWGKPQPCGQVEGVCCYLTIRAKNAFGGKESRPVDVRVKDGKVVSLHLGRGDASEPKYVTPIN
jgi:hypothetical protein